MNTLTDLKYFALFSYFGLFNISPATSNSEMYTSNTRAPNIILFVGDDFGYGDLSIYGHPTQEWGAIDQMAIDGLRFTQFYATSVFCSPSRAAILTGKFFIPIETCSNAICKGC